MKKLIALVLALALVLASCAVAFAADGDLTVDAKVTVTGFESGDTVTAYQFITWVDGTGWKLADGITGITVNEVADGLTVAELATLASQISKMTKVTGTTTGTTWEYTCGTMATAGSYLILVADSKAEHIYNPAVVSADFDSTNTAAVDLTADSAMLKKQDVTLDKTVDNKPDDYDVQVGDIVPFTVSVTVPQYSANWTEPFFQVKDTLSDGLTISALPTISGLTEGTDYTLTGSVGDKTWTIKFSENYLKNNASAVLNIKYSALVGEGVKANVQVHEETNTVELEFSNNPEDSSDHKTIDDKTYHYTFAIDGTRFGNGSEKTTELIKVGVDANGNPITSFTEGEALPTGVSPLAGAEFTLTGVGPNGTGEYSMTATSDADGRLFFNDLEVGTYTLTETKAPAGYKKDQSTHTVVISAEYYDDGLLKSYSIKIDGEDIATYTTTTEAEEIKTIVKDPDNKSFPINNPKGTELPSTGGIGTTIFYIVGGLLLVGAAVILVARKKAND